MYLILSTKYTFDAAVWWRPKASGYTQNVLDAGRFTAAEAAHYARSSPQDCLPIEETELARLHRREIVDLGDHCNFDALQAWRREALTRLQAIENLTSNTHPHQHQHQHPRGVAA